MKRQTLVTLVMGVLLFCTGIDSFSQKVDKRNIEYSGFFDTYYWRGPWHFTLQGGGTNYRGDLYPKFFLGSPDWSYYVGVGTNYKLWPRTYIGGDVNYLSLRSSYSTNSDTISFTNTAIEVVPYIRFNLLEKRRVRHSQLNKKPFRVRPYIHAGFGALYTLSSNTPNLFLDSTNLETTEIAEATGTPRITWLVPIGLGFEIWFSNRVSILPEIIYHYTFTDFLDGVQFKGNSSGTDGYYTLGVKVQVTPFAPRVKSKKKNLAPPDKYEGEKGTDYPKDPRENDPEPEPDYDYGLPGDDDDDGGGDDWDDGADDEGTDDWDDGTDDGGDDDWDDEGTDDGAGDDGGGDDWDDGTDDSGGDDDDWGW